MLTLYFRPDWPASGPVTTASICPARGCGSGTTPGPWPASPRPNNSPPSAPDITPWPVRRWHACWTSSGACQSRCAASPSAWACS